jgi:metal-sulfur cluster biosynthetic enzyme
MSTVAVSPESVKNALRNCYDPEIPINIVDLGLIYDLKIEGDSVYVRMTLTARGCPAHSFLRENVKRELLRVPGVKDATVEVVWDPPWNPDRMSEEAKIKLGFISRRPPKLPDGLKPLKTGRVVKKPDGSIVLISAREEAFKVSQHEYSVWLLCDGTKKVEEVLEALALQLNVGSTVIKNQVMEIIADMLDEKLIINPAELTQIGL